MPLLQLSNEPISTGIWHGNYILTLSLTLRIFSHNLIRFQLAYHQIHRVIPFYYMMMDNFCLTFILGDFFIHEDFFFLSSIFCTIGEYLLGSVIVISLHSDSILWLASLLCTSVPSSCFFSHNCYTIATVGGC